MIEPIYDSEIENNVSGGLLPLTPSNDITLGGLFTAPDLSTLPESFWYSPQNVKNQDVVPGSDLCVGYAVASVLEHHEDVPLSPEYIFARGRQHAKAPVESFGLNLRDGCQAAVDFGATETAKFPWSLEQNGRDFFAHYKNIPDYVDDFAHEHRQKTYLAVKDLKYDLFDDIRLAIHMNKAEECAVATGAKWRPEWLSAKDGMLPPTYDEYGTPHAFVILGYQLRPSHTSLKYEHYLVLQLSSGTEVGNGGLFYMNRATANKELSYGNFLFKDVPLAYAKFLRDTGMKYEAGFFSRLGQGIKAFLR
jgi:hypothetical protein